MPNRLVAGGKGTRSAERDLGVGGLDGTGGLNTSGQLFRSHRCAEPAYSAAKGACDTEHGKRKEWGKKLSCPLTSRTHLTRTHGYLPIKYLTGFFHRCHEGSIHYGWVGKGRSFSAIRNSDQAMGRMITEFRLGSESEVTKPSRWTAMTCSASPCGE